MVNSVSISEVFKNFSTARTDVSASNVVVPIAEPAPASVKTIDNKPITDILQTTTNINVPEKQEDHALPDDLATKTKVVAKKYAQLPDYVHRGLKGDPNSNFYEFMTLSKIPYFLGGPILVAMFAMGATRKSNPQAKASAIARAKQIGAGVAFYYLGVQLAKKAITWPVKMFRGIDMEQPFEDINQLKADSAAGHTPTRSEYHEIPESIDFTRWNFIYGQKEQNGKIIYENRDKLARKFGIDKNVQDSDSSLKNAITRLIVSAKACQYMLAAPFVALGVGIAGQDAWKHIGTNFGTNLKNILSLKSNITIKERATRGLELIKGNLTNPLKESFKSFYKLKTGKFLIATSIIAPILANIRIMQLTSLSKDKFIDISEYFKKSKHTDLNQKKQSI